MIARLQEEVNRGKTDGVRELGPVEVADLKAAVLETRDGDWDKPADYAANYNKKGAIRSAEHIIFRFSDRRETPYRYLELPAWSAWEDRLRPVLEAAVRPLGYARGFFPRVMLARLPGGAFIPPHVDGDSRGWIPHKIHVPLLTNAAAFFFLGEERFHLKEGVAYEVNNGARHSVVNGGDTDRIHLIFEYLDAELQNFEA